MASAPPSLATALPKPDWAIDLGPTNMAVPTSNLNEFPPSLAPDQVVLIANGKHTSIRPAPNSNDTEILITHTWVYARYNPASQQLWMAVENYLTHVTVNLSNYAQGLQQPSIHRIWSLTWMTFAAFNATIWIPRADWLRPCRR
ncbi:hypothetical protein K469DRAFT_50438 [Zopfia rhizophila CBS 207.26]|uniref:Uncharacterized protein n=1 Tax=Zopfia rhizophila CBS 207.26 TaxID=1314779 RepID=A0A6A6EH78_9PEZI|nr:hypothetical protein K469DRAFT_50438 [Zopfia rhizophila CBS 207.26]